MFFEKPAFPVSLSQKEAQEKVSLLLKKKHWNEFSFPSSTLFYIPYWFFSYDIFEDTEKHTKATISGHAALNAFSNKLDESVSDLAVHEGFSLENEILHDYSYRHLKARLSESEAREIIPIKIASEEQVKKQNIIISGLELLYVPIWVLDTKIDVETISFRINATTGKIMNADSLPGREKGFSELAAEAFEDLSKPEEWLSYSAEIISELSKGAGKAASGKGLSGQEIVLILAIIAIIVILITIYAP